MVNIDIHRVIDRIFSREVIEVTEWLKIYPNIQIVSRGGFVTYNNAISLAHPKAVQVSDRFHLLKNLTAYCKDYLTKFLKPQLVIEKNYSPLIINVIKCIMYRRCSFVLLRSKIILRD